MADVFSEQERSSVMRRIRSSKNSSTELRFVQFLKSNDIHNWRRNYKVKGHPDFVFLNKRIAVFIDGCFWHGHDCRNTRPASNREYWEKKREHNKKHDHEITCSFEQRGWTVVRIWECELRKKSEDIALAKIKSALNKQRFKVDELYTGL